MRDTEAEAHHAALAAALHQEVTAAVGSRDTVYVFGYGSLIWKHDGLAFASSFPGVVRGYARRFWQASPDHRGTPAVMGRVVTLVAAPGEAVHGTAFQVTAGDFAELAYREKAGYSFVEVAVEGYDGAVIQAFTFIGRPDNVFWAGEGSRWEASEAAVAAVIHSAVGPSGPNRAYFEALREAMSARGVEDPHLEALAMHLKTLDDAAAAAIGEEGAASAVTPL